jgi:hypothetical protein
MAYQRKQRKLNGSQKLTTTTNSSGHVRTTVTSKQGNVTRSQSINKNGSIRTTTTERRQGGWVDRRTHTTPSAPPLKHKAPPKPRKSSKPKNLYKYKKPNAKKNTGMNVYQFIFWIVVFLYIMFNY